MNNALSAARMPAAGHAGLLAMRLPVWDRSSRMPAASRPRTARAPKSGVHGHIGDTAASEFRPDLEHRVSEMGVSEYQRRDQRLLGKTAGAWLPSWLSTLDEISKNRVGRTGFEPVTSSVGNSGVSVTVGLSRTVSPSPARRIWLRRAGSDGVGSHFWLPQRLERREAAHGAKIIEGCLDLELAGSLLVDGRGPLNVRC
jgi:hypothetical protein